MAIGRPLDELETGLMQRIAIIDYGSGNLHSAHKAVERAAREDEIDCEVLVTADVAKVAAADRVILPGVGAFADCARGLAAVEGMTETLAEFAHARARPFLGICVGMQLLATRGLEFGETPGLGWIDGEVRLIEPDDPALKVPHMGWNTIHLCRPHPLLDGVATGSSGLHAYFVHSYHFVPKAENDVVATTDYGGAVTAMVARGNIAGTQFHPEKSQVLGLTLLANFLKWRV